MTPYRQETNLPGTQPVRFYKIVALTFLTLTIILLGVIVFSSSKKAVITITTKSDPIEVNITAGVNSANADTKLNGLITTTTAELSKSFLPSLTKQVTSKSATGMMTLHNDGADNQTLIPTTRLLTQEGAIFRIKDKATIPAKGQIDTLVYFDDKNATSSTGVGKLIVPGLSLEKQKIIYATNDKPISSVSNVGVISADDLKKAADSLGEEIINQAKGQLAVKYPDKAGVYSLFGLESTTTAKVGDETDGFSVSGKATVVAVFYSPDEVLTLAKNELNKRVVSDAENLQVSDNQPNVTLKDYDEKTNSATLNIYYNGKVSLNPESKQLQKDSFFGKNEQEVRRYLLSLDHVSNVDIQFSPAWTRTIPSLSDHVSIMVKSIE